MRILIVGDQHFRNQLPYAQAEADGRKSEWSAVITAIHTASRTCDAVVLLGDNLNSRHNHSSVLAEFVEFLDGFGEKEIHILAGNHERYGKETAIDFLKGVRPEWKIYTEPRVTIIGSIPAMMFPFMSPASLNASSVTEARDIALKMALPAHYLFHQHIVEGTTVGGALLEDIPEIVFPKTIEGRYKKIFGGHIHDPQIVSDKICVTGNIFTEQTGNTEKYIYVLDTDTDKAERIALPVKPIKKVEFPATDITTLVPETIYKCVVNDKALHGVGVDGIKANLESRGIAHVIVEQYESERARTTEPVGDLDLSLPNLLKVYSEVKKVPYEQIQRALDFVNTHENNRH